MPHSMPKTDMGVVAYDEEYLRKLKVHAIELPGTRTSDEETGIYRNALSPDTLVKDYPDVKTLYDYFEHGAKVNPNGPCLGHRPVIGRDAKTGAAKWGGYVWQSYKKVKERRENFGAGLQKLYVDSGAGSPEDKWNLGIYSINRPEWLIAEWGALAYSNATVALYDTLGPEAAEFILKHADVPIVVTTFNKVATLLHLSPQVPTLKVIVVMEPVEVVPPVTGDPNGVSSIDVLKQWGEEKGIAVYSFGEVEQIGKENSIPVRPPTPEDVWCICYTSGTTGNPKGAILTHGNGVAAQAATESLVTAKKDDVHMSYLPLAHVYEKVFIWSLVLKGAPIGFYRGDVALLMDDIALLRPMSFPSVPRLLNRIYDKIMQGALHSGSAVKAGLFRAALDAKLKNLKEGKLTHPLWDRLVFGKVQAVLGGRLRVFVSSSAPLSKDVMSFLRAVFGVNLLEAYGQTETCGSITMTFAGDYSTGHVGAPSLCNEIKLVSVPEMGYHARENKGELWARGHNIFRGYHKDPEKTAETLTEDGWIKTGDIASIDEMGRVSIIDRKKNIFKLSQGEYVAPEKLENTYIKSNFIGQIYVHGDSLQSELVGIVVPDPEFSIQWAIQHRLLPSSTPPGQPLGPGVPVNPHMVELCKDEKFRKAVQADMNKWAKADKLRGFEWVKNVALEPEGWNVQNGMLTPTFKLKRNEAAAKYRPILDTLYEELAAQKEATADEAKAKL